MKKEIILLAQASGYFRTKNEDKKSAIVSDMSVSEGFENIEPDYFVSVLHAETARRSEVYSQRAKKALDKIESDAAKPISSGIDGAFEHIKVLPPGKYVITAAQNNTDVDAVFMDALENYAKRMGAPILCAKITYNLNGFQQGIDVTEGIYYDPRVKPYLVTGHVALGGIDFIADANVLPTAAYPLTGFEAITETGVSVIIPASKIALKCTAALKGGAAKIMYSTGVCTKRNYVMRKAGAVAQSSHNIGALFVDTTSPYKPIVRQLERMENSEGFYDLDTFYTSNGKVFEAKDTVLQLGDVHAEKMNNYNMELVEEAIDMVRPTHIMLHDVCDFSSRNHHNIKDPAFMYAKMTEGATVQADLTKVARTISQIGLYTEGDVKLHIVESNHDLALERWVKETDFKEDPVNAMVYLRCMLAVYSAISMCNDSFNLLEWALTNLTSGELCANVIFHKTDESVMINGVEHGVHGHSGINGSKGSPLQFAKLGIKINTGHTHTPGIVLGCYTAGVSGSLEMGYNKGPSSWQLASVVTFENGQRQIIFS